MLLGGDFLLITGATGSRERTRSAALTIHPLPLPGPYAPSYWTALGTRGSGIGAFTISGSMCALPWGMVHMRVWPLCGNYSGASGTLSPAYAVL